jgi:site-specific recombinase XerD
MKLQELLTCYLEYLKKVRNLQDLSILSIKKTICLFFRWLEGFEDEELEEVEAIDEAIVLEFLKDSSSKLNQRTLREYLRILKNFFRYLYLFRLKTDYTLANIRLPRIDRWQRLRIPLTKEEVKRIFQEALKKDTFQGYRDFTMLVLLYYYGLRSKELRQLKIEDIDFANHFIKISAKGPKERLLPLPEDIQKILKSYLALRPKSSLPYVFITARPNSFLDTVLAGTLRNYGLKAGIKKPVSPYVFRSTCATHMLEYRNLGILEIQKWLGHSSLESTRRYVHISGRLIKEALNLHPLNKMNL